MFVKNDHFFQEKIEFRENHKIYIIGETNNYGYSFCFANPEKLAPDGKVHVMLFKVIVCYISGVSKKRIFQNLIPQIMRPNRNPLIIHPMPYIIHKNEFTGNFWDFSQKMFRRMFVRFFPS